MKLEKAQDFFNPQDILCVSCRSKLIAKPVKITIDDFVVYALYPYEPTFQRLLIQYKDLFDEALAPIFLYPYRKQLRKWFKGKKVVPIPSHESHIQQRGFDHVPLMFASLNLEVEEVLEKVSQRHQARSHFMQRHDLLFRLKKKIIGSVILIDDMCTTSESLRQAKTCLDRDVVCFTIGYHPLLLKQYQTVPWRGLK